MGTEQRFLGELYQEIENQKEFKDLGESLKRLQKNKDFNKIFTSFLFDKKLKDKIRELTTTSEKESKELILSQIIGIQSVMLLLESIEQESSMAVDSIEHAQREIDNITSEV